MKESPKIIDPLQQWIKEYLPNAEGKKENTIKSYKATWRLMLKFFLKEGVDATEVTYSMLTYDRIMDFLAWLEKERNCKVATRNNRLSALSKFADYSMNTDFNAAYDFYQAIQKIPFKKNNDATERAYFTQEEVKILMDCPTPKDNMGIRDHTLLQFMYSSGERAEEVCTTKVGDVKFLSDGKASVLVHGKGGKTRRIKISQQPASALKKYIKYRRIGNQHDTFVFPSQRNVRMSVSCVEDIFQKYVTMAQKSHPDLFTAASYPPHSMRHTTAVHMLESGVPLVVVKQFLGHEHIETTEIYAKLSPQAANAKIADWDKKYWAQYLDEPLPEEETSFEANDGIPMFLK